MLVSMYALLFMLSPTLEAHASVDVDATNALKFKFQNAKYITVREVTGTAYYPSSDHLEKKQKTTYVFSCKTKCINFINSEYYEWIKKPYIMKKPCNFAYIGSINITMRDGSSEIIYIAGEGKCFNFQGRPYLIEKGSFPRRNYIR